MRISPTQYSNVLQINQGGKGIPYGGIGQIREDGEANYGFKNLKGSPERIAEVPELQDDDALRDLIVSLNQPESAFATIGCVSGPVHEQQGHRVSGYVEFAFNSVEAVADAASYFPIFFHFDRALHSLKFDDQVHFHWELMAATFVFLVEARGFTMTVTVNTGWYADEAGATLAWQNGLNFLAKYLTQVPRAEGPSLFKNAMN